MLKPTGVQIGCDNAGSVRKDTPTRCFRSMPHAAPNMILTNMHQDRERIGRHPKVSGNGWEGLPQRSQRTQRMIEEDGRYIGAVFCNCAGQSAGSCPPKKVHCIVPSHSHGHAENAFAPPRLCARTSGSGWEGAISTFADKFNLHPWPVISSFKYRMIRSRLAPRLENCFSQMSVNLARTLRLISS